ncbi:MAG: hypothetical protein LQ338_007944 [Usnochroma carphineum]|nr:MAG: hypothetical protein LQ338_007944 [Usnochroma carphineum]
MPWIIDRPRRPSRHSSAPQKPLSQAPAVLRTTSPIRVRKSSNASKAQLRPPRRQEATSVPNSAPRSSPTGDTATKNSSRRHIDVFDFMDNTEEGEEHQHTDNEGEDDEAVESTGADTAASSPVSAHHPTSHYSDLEVNADQQSKRQTWHGGYNQAGSFHSDSGISMGSSSGDGDSPILQHKYPSIRRTSTHEPSIPEDNGLNVSCEPFPTQIPAFGAHAWPQLSAIPKDSPEAYYARAVRGPPKSLDDTTIPLPPTPPELSPQLPRGRKQNPAKEPSSIKHGYSQLALEISAQDDAVIKPVYRKFETLNNRILLYLQDEISELEADLEELDAAITREEQYVGRTGYPASRRAEAKAPSQLQWHRNNLMERCASKVETYSESLNPSRCPWETLSSALTSTKLMIHCVDRALTSYSNLTQTLSPSSKSDLSTYRKWIMKHNPIAKPEASFLNDRKDLVTVSQTRQHATPTSLRYSPFTVAPTVLTTIMVFKFVPQFFARLVMSAVIGLALMCMVSPGSLMDVQSLKEKRRGLGV